MSAFTTIRSLRCTLLLAAGWSCGVMVPSALAQAAVPSIEIPVDKAYTFEVVSVRRNTSAPLGPDQIKVTPDGWRMRQGSLMAALLAAYVPTTSDAMMYTVSTLSGVPDWMQTELYDVDAKVSEVDIAAWQNPLTQPAMLRSMMRTMLADRCKLVAHRGSKEVAVYSLVVGKGGPRLKTAVPGDAHPGATPLPGGGEFLSSDGSGNAGFYDAPLRALAVVLSNLAGRPVEDETGLTGRYDMVFRRPRAGGASMEADSGPDPAPTIFSVVEGFGLKLETRKRVVETLVVDHVERPSVN